MTLSPDFLVIGAGRSGTTAVHHGLAQHPQIFVTAHKSPNFFVSQEPIPAWENSHLRAMASHWVRNLQDYQALFRGASPKQVKGEVSPVYLQAMRTAERIHALCPEVRLIAILRDPVDRAHAHYWGRRRDGLEVRPTFEEAVDEELARGEVPEVAFGSYLACGLYDRFLEPYYARFPQDRMRIFLFEDLRSDPQALWEDLFGFLGVDRSLRPQLEGHHGRTGEVPTPWLRQLWTGSVGLRTRLRPLLPAALRDLAGPLILRQVEKPKLNPDTRQRLLPWFRQDVLRLQERLHRDLSRWLI